MTHENRTFQKMGLNLQILTERLGSQLGRSSDRKYIQGKNGMSSNVKKGKEMAFSMPLEDIL